VSTKKGKGHIQTLDLQGKRVLACNGIIEYVGCKIEGSKRIRMLMKTRRHSIDISNGDVTQSLCLNQDEHDSNNLWSEILSSVKWTN